MGGVSIATGLRERKKKRTRQAIIEAAWELFRQKGYDAATIDEIADNADVSRRTFFRYFPTKEAVVFHSSADRLVLLQSLLDDGGRGFEAVSRACLGIARHYAENRDDVVEQFKLVESSPALTLWKAEIEQKWTMAIAEALVERRTAAEKRRARILAGAIFGAIRATLTEWLSEDGRTNLVRLGTQTLHIFAEHDPQALEPGVAARLSGKRRPSANERDGASDRG